MKNVIFNHCGTLAITTLDNYSRRIMNGNDITTCPAFNSPDQIIEYFSTYCGYSKNDFIVEV